jgi:hypothetical protein
MFIFLLFPSSIPLQHFCICNCVCVCVLWMMPDIVLKDKLVVYDNERGQIGWKSYDCKQYLTFNCDS